MTTPTAPSQGGSNTSKSISAGADVLVSLSEEEKAKIIVALLSYRSLETQFAMHRMQTEQMMQQMNELQGRYDAVCFELQQARFSHSEMTAPTNGQLVWQPEENDRARKVAKKERDEIKAVTGGEISELIDKVAALQSEIAALRSGAADGQTQYHGCPIL